MQVIEPTTHYEATMRIKWIILFLLSGWINASNADGLKEVRVSKSFWDTYTAALRGDKVAQFQTGVIYERGIGVEVNQTNAAQWYEKAAHQGYVDAQYNLALLYASGRGVEKNLEWAMIWLAKAAKQGDKEARTLLLEIIDGKHEKSSKLQLDANIAITPLRMKTTKDTVICDQNKNCTAIKIHTTVTSRVKSGDYYKVSGTGGKHGWEPYEGEGWIHEKDVQRD